MLEKIRRHINVCFLLLPFFLLFNLITGIDFVSAGDSPFTYPGNQGYTGIMEVPTARIMREATYRFGAGQIDPYRYYYIALSPYERWEISGTVTEVLGVRASTADARFRGYGNTRDKSIGVKFRFLDESKWLPAMAVSIIDPHGTRLYGSQSIVASKQIYPFDFTLGIGNGRFGKAALQSSGEGFRVEMLSDPKQWARDAQVFWGVQCALSDKYALMFEYNPIRYSRQTSDPARSRYFSDSSTSPYNIGIRWKPLPWTEIDVSYQRGNQLGVNVSMLFDIGQPLIPIYDAPYEEKNKDRLKTPPERLSEALYNSGFSDIGILENGNDILIQLQNDKYYYYPKAIAVVARLVQQIMPQDRNVRIVFTQ
ncbi:MAG TPA: YjbH domain-containing protein, partial [Syntrophorhabdaceae bacterium]|nr:YjbH domain-containing protein [Syntrophorhabdaceae bacterium]